MQLHGDEDDKTVASCGPGVIKAIRFDRLDDRGRSAPLVRGSPRSQQFWSTGPRAERASRSTGHVSPTRSPRSPLPKPVIVAGGLDPDNVGEAIARGAAHGRLMSRAASNREPGEKDHGAISAFCEAVRAADAEVADTAHEEPGHRCPG
jgi:phosphoribosylanthranilate isomerase